MYQLVYICVFNLDLDWVFTQESDFGSKEDNLSSSDVSKIRTWTSQEPTPYGFRQWASYQIRKIPGYACTGNAGKVFPSTLG